MDLRQPYLTEQLIAYIGNKRALLPFLHDAFQEAAGGRSGLTFSDPFAGSGAVSRLARAMGFSVLSNDWERYSFAINSCYLEVGASELPDLFRGTGGLDAVLARLNALPAPPPERQYIARHFAPRSTAEADWRTERLFYTRENALSIDAMRELIEEMYPGMPSDPCARKEKAVLLGPLLYEASTHTNTSGVFKACHRGFGGHGGDALTRIMAPIRARAPVLTDCPLPSRVFCQDAELFASSHPADVCYLDPPYASHQYGSNYFMLTTIALWDKPPVSEERTPDGRLREKAGIRKDWISTRSAYCSRSSAADAFRRLASAADCRLLCVSYSDEGVLTPEELADILSATGALTVRSTQYARYPGGKLTIGGPGRSVELLFMVDRTARSGSAVRREVEDLMLQARLGRLMRMSFHPSRVRKAFRAGRNGISFGEVRLAMRGLYRFDDPAAAHSAVPREDAARFYKALSACRFSDRREEIDVLMRLVLQEADPGRAGRLRGEILRNLRGIAHRKYQREFAAALARVKGFTASRPAGASFMRGLAAVEETARKRFAAAR